MATTLETTERSTNPLLTTHYYKANYKETKEGILATVKDLGYTLKFCNDEYGQIHIEGPKFSLQVRLNNLSPRETAVNFVLDIFAIFGAQKMGNQILEALYAKIATHIEFKGLALH